MARSGALPRFAKGQLEACRAMRAKPSVASCSLDPTLVGSLDNGLQRQAAEPHAAPSMVSRDEILDHLWGSDYVAESNVVTVSVSVSTGKESGRDPHAAVMMARRRTRFTGSVWAPIKFTATCCSFPSRRSRPATRA